MQRSRWQLAFTWGLVAFSVLLASRCPWCGVMWLAALMGIAALAALVLPVGWSIPGMIAGVYGGLIADMHVKGGAIESQMWETVTSIGIGAIVGLAIGLAIDGAARRKPE